MRTIKFLGKRHAGFLKASLITMFLFTVLAARGLSQADFSGKWEFDKAASDKTETGDASFKGTIILNIEQNNVSISFSNTFIRPGMKDYLMKPDSYSLTGNITTDNSGTGPAKKSAKWSPDKKALTTSLVMTDKIDGVAQDFLTANTYKLSADGKTLTVEEFHKSKLNGEKTIKKVYKKK
jgi:hypothetical protein